MATTSPAAATPLRDRLDSLVAFEPQAAPVFSVYLNLGADQHGRDSYDAFLRKAFVEHRTAFREHTPARASFDRDAERIQAYLRNELTPAVNAAAIFARAGERRRHWAHAAWQRADHHQHALPHRRDGPD